MSTDQTDIDRLIVTGLTVEDASYMYAATGDGLPVSGDAIARARSIQRAWARLVRDTVEALRPAFETFQQIMRTIQRATRDDYVLTSPKVAARIRQGHPPIRQAPLMHNGRKPRR